MSITLKELIDSYNSKDDIKVLSKNLESGELEYKSILNAAKMNSNANVIEIMDVDSGKQIICTPDHKIFTLNRGWIKAADLVENDILDIQ